MTFEETNNRISEFQEKIASLPIGSITKKTVNGKTYFYHRFTENKKRREKFISPKPGKAGTPLPKRSAWTPAWPTGTGSSAAPRAPARPSRSKSWRSPSRRWARRCSWRTSRAIYPACASPGS